MLRDNLKITYDYDNKHPIKKPQWEIDADICNEYDEMIKIIENALKPSCSYNRTFLKSGMLLTIAMLTVSAVMAIMKSISGTEKFDMTIPIGRNGTCSDNYSPEQKENCDNMVEPCRTACNDFHNSKALPMIMGFLSIGLFIFLCVRLNKIEATAPSERLIEQTNHSSKRSCLPCVSLSYRVPKTHKASLFSWIHNTHKQKLINFLYEHTPYTAHQIKTVKLVDILNTLKTNKDNFKPYRRLVWFNSVKERIPNIPNALANLVVEYSNEVDMPSAQTRKI